MNLWLSRKIHSWLGSLAVNQVKIGVKLLTLEVLLTLNHSLLRVPRRRIMKISLSMHRSNPDLPKIKRRPFKLVVLQVSLLQLRFTRRHRVPSSNFRWLQTNNNRTAKIRKLSLGERKWPSHRILAVASLPWLTKPTKSLKSNSEKERIVCVSLPSQQELAITLIIQTKSIKTSTFWLQTSKVSLLRIFSVFAMVMDSMGEKSAVTWKLILQLKLKRGMERSMPLTSRVMTQQIEYLPTLRRLKILIFRSRIGWRSVSCRWIKILREMFLIVNSREPLAPSL